MFNAIKNMFVDKDTGKLKIGSILAAAGGAALGSMLLAPMLAGGFLGGAAGIVAPILGATALLAGKELLLPMLTGSKTSQHTTQTHGFHAAAAPQQDQAHAQSANPQVETPNVPHKNDQRQR